MPLALFPYQEFLPVGYPHDHYELTDAERRVCEYITAITVLIALLPEVLALRLHDRHFHIFDDRLQLWVVRAVRDFNPQKDRILPLLKDLAAQGRTWMEEWYREDNGPDADPATAPRPALDTFAPPHLLPYMPLDTAEVTLPQGYLTLNVVEPYRDPDIPEACEERKKIFRFLALYQVAFAALSRFEQAPSAVRPDLCYQFQLALRDGAAHLVRIHASCWEKAEQAQVREPEWLLEESKAKAAAAEALARIVVLGDNKFSGQYTVFGFTVDGILIAVTQSLSQFIIANGQQGVGKTQGAMIMREGSYLELPGLTVMKQPNRTIEHLVDFHRGETRLASLCGLYCNPYSAQWQILADRFGVNFTRDRARFPRMNAGVMPGRLAYYKEKYAEFVERGLNFFEIGIHPEEQSSLFYRLLLSVGTGGNGQVRTQRRAVLDSIIGNLGMGRDPDAILKEMERAKFTGFSEHAVRSEMKFIFFGAARTLDFRACPSFAYGIWYMGGTRDLRPPRATQPPKKAVPGRKGRHLFHADPLGCWWLGGWGRRGYLWGHSGRRKAQLRDLPAQVFQLRPVNVAERDGADPTGMTQDLLDGIIGPPSFGQVRGEGMPEGMPRALELAAAAQVGEQLPQFLHVAAIGHPPSRSPRDGEHEPFRGRGANPSPRV